MNYSDIVIIATGPHRFHGAGQIMSQYLREFSRRGAKVIFVGPAKPFLFDISDDLGVRFKYIKPISASYYQPTFANSTDNSGLVSQDLILLLNLSEELVCQAKNQIKNGKKIIIWGTYLFPSAFAALLAVETLSYFNIESTFWVTPAGSDIWEIGPQLSSISKRLLNSPLISSIITYTSQFAEEIKKRYTVSRTIDTIYPIINFDRFFPIPDEKRMLKRTQMGISKQSFVICSHSNMRPVKCPEDVIHIAHEASIHIEQKTTLLMIGPKSKKDKNYNDEKFEIKWEGVVQNVEDYLQISDIELNCSRHDSFNLSLAEAMASGLPCISTDVVGIGAEIQQSKSGYLFPFCPIESWPGDSRGRYHEPIEFITKLANSETLRKEYGFRAHKHAKVTFNSDRIMPQFLRLMHFNNNYD